jgi:hypothetical protein
MMQEKFVSQRVPPAEKCTTQFAEILFDTGIVGIFHRILHNHYHPTATMERIKYKV